MYSIPPSLQAVSSSGSIGREASEMSVSPAQNFSKPPEVPAAPTVMLTSGFSSPKSSAAASRERLDRARTVDRDAAGETAGLAARGGIASAARVIVTACGNAEREGEAGADGE